MQNLQKFSLYISNIEKSLEFYKNKLGMKLLNKFKKDEKEFFHLKFNEDTNEAILELIYEKDNTQTIYQNKKERLTGYWKFSISIKDVNIAREKLIEQGVEVTTPFQVPNVAYLCHFKDPDGYSLELIQHKFEQNHIPKVENPNYKLGNKAILSLITYRVKNIEQSLEFYTNTLNMKLFSKMDVSQRGFDLYFLGYTQDKLPNENIEAIENREWLWQRDFTMIELQHIHKNSQDKNFYYEVGKTSGFDNITILDNYEKTLKDFDKYTIVITKSSI